MKKNTWITVIIIAVILFAIPLVTREPKTEAQPVNQKIDLNVLQAQVKKKQEESNLKLTKVLKDIKTKEELQEKQLAKLLKENKNLKKELDTINLQLPEKTIEGKIDSSSVASEPNIKKKGFLKRVLKL